ncbi:MAG TPA: hypothetical protein VJY62_02395 [Bacteroidia bacterium]|nr:hypothetical protein [Bacteroidia bacterium]
MITVRIKNRLRATVKFNTPINIIGEDAMISVVVTENILKCQPVTANGQLADSANLFHKNKVVGLAMADIAISTSGNVQTDGKMQNSSWSWTVGAMVYINGQGILSQTPPASPSSLWTQVIGIAYKTDTIEIEIADAYLF